MIVENSGSIEKLIDRRRQLLTVILIHHLLPCTLVLNERRSQHEGYRSESTVVTVSREVIFISKVISHHEIDEDTEDVTRQFALSILRSPDRAKWASQALPLSGTFIRFW